MSFSPLISVSMVSGDDSAILIRSLLSTMGAPFNFVNSIIAQFLCAGHRRSAAKLESFVRGGLRLSSAGQLREVIKFVLGRAEEESRCGDTRSGPSSPAVIKKWALIRDGPQIHAFTRRNP